MTHNIHSLQRSVTWSHSMHAVKTCCCCTADYCKVWPCGTGAPCEKAECEPITGACKLSTQADGIGCVDATGLSGVCKSGACVPAGESLMHVQ
jgi:hypothetical protein